MEKKLKAIDLFCGAGGMSLGLEMANFSIELGLDFIKDCEETHNKNFPNVPFICGDITNIKGSEILNKIGLERGELTLVSGGPPCQGFSTVNGKSRFLENPKNKLFVQFVRIIDELSPTWFIMENVIGLLSMNSGTVKEAIFEAFKNIGYNVEAKVLNAVDYGVPQNRKRAIFIGNNAGYKIDFPEPSHGQSSLQFDFFNDGKLKPFVTVGDAFKGINKNSKLENHNLPTHADIVLKRMSFVPEGGNQKDIPKEFKPPQKFLNTYGRLHREKPSNTIHTRFDVASTGSLYHPTENRALTVREGARLQSFPDNYIFSGKKGSQYRQVGNAVPPLLAKAIGDKIVSIIEKAHYKNATLLENENNI
jgi:DNA (cytosine-5)-methyltransferase 1